MYENILLDVLPKEYEGYLINYSFRTGILISQALGDTETFKDDLLLLIFYTVKGFRRLKSPLMGLNGSCVVVLQRTIGN